MAAHGYATMRVNEIINIKSSEFVPDIGNETLVAVVVTLRDTSMAPVGVDGADASGFISTSDPDPYAWYLMDPTGLGVGVGRYTLNFLGTDSTGQTYASSVGLKVLPAGL